MEAWQEDNSRTLVSEIVKELVQVGLIAPFRICPETGKMRYQITKMGLAIRIPDGATSAEMKALVRVYKKREKLMKPRAPIQLDLWGAAPG